MINKVCLKIPFDASSLKYAAVWQRARLKLKAQFFMKKIGKDDDSERRLMGSTIEEIEDDGEEEDENYLVRRYSILVFNKERETTMLEQTPFLVIHPDAKLKKLWNVILALALVYTAAIMPYVMAFIETEQWDIWFFIALVMDILFLGDFIFNCTTAYFDNEGNLVVNRKKIMVNYLRGWFFIDVVASFPFNFLEISGSNSQQMSKSFLRVIKVPRIYRLLRISKLFKVVSQSNYGFFEKIRDYLNIKHSSMKLMTSCIIIIVCIHISGCFWYYIARLNNFDDTTWVYNLKYLNESTDTIYLTCLYWAITTMTTVGYGDIHAFNNTEKIFCILWMALGIFFISFSIGRLASVINTTESKDNLLLHKLAAIEEFCSEANINKDLQAKLRKALKFSTDKQGGSWGQKEVILSELPRSLKYDLAMNMFQGAAKKIEFFKNHDPALVASIVPLLQPIFMTEKENVYKEGEIADEIYFMTQGRISYCFGQENSSVAWIHRGNYFGDIEIVLGVNRLYTAHVVLPSELFIMNRYLIQTIIETFPQVWEEISREAVTRQKLYEKAKVKLQELHNLRTSGRLKSIKFSEFKRIVEDKCRDRQDETKKSEVQIIKKLVLKLDELIKEVSEESFYYSE